MPLFSPATTFLLIVAILLIILNFLVHRLKRSSQVRVTFIPPTAKSSVLAPMELGSSEMDWSSRMDAHISSTNQKINQLHSRLVAVEQTLSRMMGNDARSSLLSHASETMDETRFNVIPSGFESAKSNESIVIQSTSKSNTKR